MTNREKAFVLKRLAEAAKWLGITGSLLEETRVDQQDLLLLIIEITGGDVFDGF